MINVLKSFLGIVVSCFGIGLSMAVPGFFDLVLAAIFVVLDLIGIFLVLKNSKSDLLGVFYTFCPSLMLIEVIRDNVFLMGIEAKMVMLSLECSFVLVLIWLLIYSAFLCLKKVEILIKNWGRVFSPFFYKKTPTWYDWSFFNLRYFDSLFFEFVIFCPNDENFI